MLLLVFGGKTYELSWGHQDGAGYLVANHESLGDEECVSYSESFDAEHFDAMVEALKEGIKTTSMDS